MTRQPALRVRDLTKSFGGTTVLTGVDLTVEAGSITALLGSNGAGKTTLIRILCTLLAADSGTAEVAGYDLARQADRVRASISLTGQFAAVDQTLTGRENLELVARLRHLSAPRQVAAELLERFGLTDAADRASGTYSGGMRRRLDIAMSLVGRPPLVFLDEPTTGLDPQSRIAVWDSVAQLSRAGTTVLLTTQHLEEAEHLADRIAILHGGRIIAEGTVAELRALLPPTERVLVEQRPSLEEIFLAVVGRPSPSSSADPAARRTAGVRP